MNDNTPLLDLPTLPKALGIANIWVKDESKRELGNFKSLGGGSAAASALAVAGMPRPILICASDGNHGLAVATAARAHGAIARIYLPNSVNWRRAGRIAELGAQVVWVDGSYDIAVALAVTAASAGEGVLIADTSHDARHPVVAEVMAGYGKIPAEMLQQLGANRPTHVFVQAGVGGLAAAIAEGLNATPRGELQVVVVEPIGAACVGMALAAGYPVQVNGDLVTCADMLSCGLASAGAVEILRRSKCQAITVSETCLAEAPSVLAAFGGPKTSTSGAAGLAGLILASTDPLLRTKIGLNELSRVAVVVTEGADGQAFCP